MKFLLSSSVSVSSAVWRELMFSISLKSAVWVLLPACRQRPAQRWSDANNANASTNGSNRRLIPCAPRGTGIGKLHRHVNSPNVARSLCQVSTEEGVLRSTPSALMEVREAAWAKRWLRNTADSQAFVAELVSLRAQAIAEDVLLLDPVTVDKLDQTLRRIPDNTGLGCDCVEPGAIKHAPVDAKRELCLILDSIIRTGVLPWDLLHVIIALLL